MSNVTVTRPDSRVNLGGGEASHRKAGEDGYGFTLSIPLSFSHVRAIAGEGIGDPVEAARLVDQWITDFLSPHIEAMGRELDARVARGRAPSCRTCTGPLVGSEIRRGVCGHCSREVRL